MSDYVIILLFFAIVQLFAIASILIFLDHLIREVKSLSDKVRILCRVIENCNSLDKAVRLTFFEGEKEE